LIKVGVSSGNWTFSDRLLGHRFLPVWAKEEIVFQLAHESTSLCAFDFQHITSDFASRGQFTKFGAAKE